jgi:hypothetical protein
MLARLQTSYGGDNCVALRAANTCASVERPLLHATSADTSASSSRRSRPEVAGRSVLAVVPWRSRCADGLSSTASRSRSRRRREGSALPNVQERSSSKGLRPINLSRCSMRTRRRRGPLMRFMPAAVASHPLRERSSRSRRGIWSGLAGRPLRQPPGVSPRGDRACTHRRHGHHRAFTGRSGALTEQGSDNADSCCRPQASAVLHCFFSDQQVHRPGPNLNWRLRMRCTSSRPAKVTAAVR